MPTLDHDPGLAAYVDAVQAIPVIPTILDVVCRTTGMGFAAVARVTEDRWVACGVDDRISFGLAPGGELKVATTICSEIRDHRRPVVIDNVAEDELFCDHHTPARYGFQSYASFPITLADGRFFGTLCAIDPHPRKLDTPEVTGMFTLFAELISFHLDAHERVKASDQALAVSRADLDEEREASALREQFIAVLGHDMRNPVASIAAGAQLLRRQSMDEQGRSILGAMQASVMRVTGLIDNVMDFARGRLGGGITLVRAPVDLAPLLTHVVGELSQAHPDREILTDLALAGTVDVDAGRISQLLSNLVGNALTHGATDRPVRVTAGQDGDGWRLAVANGGQPIPSEAMAKLFQPFERGGGRSSLQGLGLGLYISSQIAAAHGGTLTAESGADETVFTFRMPVAA